MPEQDDWNFCHNCSCMFFRPIPGHCIAGGEHDAQGFVFVLPFDNPPGPFAQEDWAFCNKCSVLFFAGNPGHCVKGGGHDAGGSFNFVLPHDVPEAPGTQENWRFCNKCSAMFFGGNAGRCVQGGGHEGGGSFNFVLPHGDDFLPPTEVDRIVLSSLVHPPGRRFLNGRVADHGVDLAANVGSTFGGTQWRRRRRGDLWLLRCLTTDPGQVFLAGTTSATVLISRPQDGPGGKPQTWRATPVGDDTFTLECLPLAGVSDARFLDGALGNVILTATGTQWKVGFPPAVPFPTE